MSLNDVLTKLRYNHNNSNNHTKNKNIKTYEYRLQQLKQLKLFITENELIIQEALKNDLGRSLFEGIGVELLPIVTEIDYIISNLRKWMKPTFTPVPIWMAPASSEITYEPYGVCLILGPFNYPVLLVINALVGAIASGNSVVMKPSEMTSHVEKVFSSLLMNYLDPDYFYVATGGVEVTTELLSLRWDKIFFTGSTRVGKIVLKAAAENLTPVSLELGGKSPTIIDQSVGDLEVAAQRILWGKCMNAGQTCIAPDYIYCHEKVYDKFLLALKNKLNQFYGEDKQKSESFGRIVNSTHWKRLNDILQDCKPSQIYAGGHSDVNDLYIEPTILVDVDAKKSKAMADEIFGPILPVFKFKDIEDVVTRVNEREKPLTMYIFARNRKLIDHLINNISSGSAVVNETVFHFSNHYLPFGGIGHSGMGGYHGYFSFLCFSHQRSIMRRDDHMLLDIPLRYPPYSTFAFKIFRYAATIPIVQPAITGESIRSALLWSISVGVSTVAVLSYMGKLN